MGRLQELLDKVAEKNPQKALELMLKLSESDKLHQPNEIQHKKGLYNFITTV